MCIYKLIFCYSNNMLNGIKPHSRKLYRCDVRLECGIECQAGLDNTVRAIKNIRMSRSLIGGIYCLTLRYIIHGYTRWSKTMSKVLKLTLCVWILIKAWELPKTQLKPHSFRCLFIFELFLKNCFTKLMENAKAFPTLCWGTFAMQAMPKLVSIVVELLIEWNWPNISNLYILNHRRK